MSEIHLNNTCKNYISEHYIAKIQLKSDNINPFGGLFCYALPQSATALDTAYTSTQWMRTPLRSIPRNQVIWRLANWWMAVASFSRMSS